MKNFIHPRWAAYAQLENERTPRLSTSELSSEGGLPKLDENKSAIEMDRLRRNLQQSWLTNQFLGSPKNGTTEIASTIEKAFQDYLAHEQLQYARCRLAGLSILLLLTGVGAWIWPTSFRYGWATRLMSTQSPTGAGARFVNRSCECTMDGMSGSVVVDAIGCDAHDEDDWLWCYVADPERCATALSSYRHPGAGWLFCGSLPAHINALDTTSKSSFIGAAIMACGAMALGCFSLSQKWAGIVGLVILGVYEGFLLPDVRMFMIHGQVSHMYVHGQQGDELFRIITTGAWEVGQAYRLLLTLFFLLVLCNNSGLDFVRLVFICLLGDLSFLSAELALFLQSSSVGHQLMDEWPMLLLLTSLFSVTALWGAWRINRLQRELFLRSYTLNADVVEKLEAIEMKHTQILAIFCNPRLSRQQHKSGVRLPRLELEQEMKFILQLIPSVYAQLLPAATVEEAGFMLRQHKPRILIFSGHGHNGGLAFETSRGELASVEVVSHKFVRMLSALSRSNLADRQLECVFINACSGLSLARLILAEPLLAHLTVICWDSITADVAARSFAQGFCDELGHSLKRLEGAEPDSLDVSRAFVAGCGAFERCGFRWGDPSEYLHQPPHPHLIALPDDHATCQGCVPPVSGVVVLLRCAASGEIVEYCPMPERGNRLEALLEASQPTPAVTTSQHSIDCSRAATCSVVKQSSAPSTVHFGAGSSITPRHKWGDRHFLRNLRQKTTTWAPFVIEEESNSEPRSCQWLINISCILLLLGVVAVVVYLFLHDLQGPSASARA